MIIEQKLYDGLFIHKRFAYQYFRDKVAPTGNIVTFRCPAKVEAAGMIDSEDLLQNDFIYSEDMVHFCWEIPNLCSFGAVSFQRLFNSYIGDILGQLIQHPVQIEGDDIFLTNVEIRGITAPRGKCSVSITHNVNGAAIGHTGINIVAGKHAPNHAASTFLSERDAHKFQTNVLSLFYQTTNNIFVATTKVI